MTIKLRVTASIAATAILIFAAAVPAGAQCIQGNCKNGHGVYQWAKGARYEGEFKDGDFHGQGTYTWPDGKKFTGAFKNNKRNGVGTYAWPNGSSYAGEWKDGRKHGIGTFAFADGSRYEGQWRDGRKSGMGIYTFPSGTSESGLWIADEIIEKMEIAEVRQKLDGLKAPAPKPEPSVQTALSPAPPLPTDPATPPAPPAPALKSAGAVPAGPSPFQPAAQIAGKEKKTLPATKIAPPSLPAAFDLAVRTLPLNPGKPSTATARSPLFSRGAGHEVGAIRLDIEAAGDPKTITAMLSVENRTDCLMELTAWIRQDGTYLKLVDWNGEDAVMPQGNKTASKSLALPKSIDGAAIHLKPQGTFRACP
jgi:hypothetical protein